MTSKERMLMAIENKKPDMVPVSPDISNMIPCKLTGKPFWDIYLYRDPPLWKAYIDAVKYFDFDGWLYNVSSIFNEVREEVKEVIILKTKERIITRKYKIGEKGKEWSPLIKVYYRDNPPATLKASQLGLEKSPERYKPITGIKFQKKDLELLKEVKDYMGDKGAVAVSVGMPSLGKPDLPGVYSVYDYYDRYDEVKERMHQAEERIVKRLKKILAQSVKPDVILTGCSGCLIFNTPPILRDIALPCLQKITKLCKEAKVPSQVHCCGPEKEMVKMCAEETDLNNINPLEIPPMGDCNLREIKEKYGKKLSLMGNLHTSSVMLMGSPRDVEEASKKAIDDDGEGGGFILSTGDQCGRDTPEKNIFKMIEVARTYGKY